MAARVVRALAVVGALALLAPAFASAATPASAPTPVVAVPGAEGPHSVAALAARLSPAVVNISSSRRLHATGATKKPGAGSNLPQLDQPQLDQNGGGDNSGSDQGDAMEEAESLGSGFIISADGTIVTNNHVIEGGDQIVVYLTDGTHWPARILGADAKTDLAVLKIDAKRPLPFVEFGDSDTAEVGDWVMAIGDPFGLGGTVTLGIVSARNRDIQSGPYDSYIQTDASINEGNSGGPLFDMQGKVVGINTAIIARGGASLGIGFAVPGNLAKPVVEQLKLYGEARRGWIGVGIQDVTDEIAASLGRPDTHGAMVTDVTKSGPGDGVLQPGDIILSFDGKPVEEMRDLPRLVAETDVGKSVPLEVFRGDKQQTLTVKVGRLDDGETHVASAAPPKAVAPPAAPKNLAELLGFEVAPVDAAKRKTYALPSTLQGLVITSVKEDSDAADNGLLAGYVITEVNEQKVLTLADMQAIVTAAQKAGRSAVMFRVLDSTGAGRYIGVKITG